MKYVIFDTIYGYYAITSEENYYRRIWNNREIQRLYDFDNTDEIIECFCKHFGCKPEDFIVKDCRR